MRAERDFAGSCDTKRAIVACAQKRFGLCFEWVDCRDDIGHFSPRERVTLRKKAVFRIRLRGRGSHAPIRWARLLPFEVRITRICLVAHGAIQIV